ncbi:catalase family protein [Sphingomonas sp. NBWT7]|uniref:catalase family protein n=1 Tax=Sphingomonas sp. NBWT7 TaxID=2596913 RepID=UPI00162828E1|nr:catalase family protein [Sphingomonas sp. NBWT7]QNE32969.1 catalase family protein [Sphingomonas sp. NBWT7]
MAKTPVRYSADVEDVKPDETETIAALNQTFDRILERTADDYGHAVRSVHAKAHGFLEGTLTVHADLPPELAQGLFITPGEHKVIMRFSTNAGDILPDTISLPRGVALKVLDVDGERLPDAEGRTQDFIMVNGPVFQSKTADKFLGNLKLLAGTTDKLEGTKEILSKALRGVNTVLSTVGIESTKVQTLGGAPNSDPLGETYYSVTPFRYGEYIAKFALFPVSKDLTDQTDTTIDASHRPDALREVIRSEARVLEMEWELRVQLCRDLDAQPIEDPTVEWDQDDTPFQPVATVRAARQDSLSEDKFQQIDEQMRFSIWTGLVAHRPLGNINRARKETYRHSADFRARVNGCPYHEPSGAPF